jgi:hypothetical protein
MAGTFAIWMLVVNAVFFVDSFHTSGHRFTDVSGPLSFDYSETLWERDPLNAVRQTALFFAWSAVPTVAALQCSQRPTAGRVSLLWIVALLNVGIYGVAFLSAGVLLPAAMMFIVASLLATVVLRQEERQPPRMTNDSK